MKKLFAFYMIVLLLGALYEGNGSVETVEEESKSELEGMTHESDSTMVLKQFQFSIKSNLSNAF
ncbi:MAG: hypothetical protein HRT61_05855 [Ekhidna sp.]|nr:hypothetical protein [Ekhidna sp.]